MHNANNKAEEFTVLLEKYKRLIVKIASMYFMDTANRNDLMQEIALQLWKAFSKLNEPIDSSTWVYRIALNVAISAFRKEVNRKKTLANYQQEAQLFEITKEEEITAKLQQLYQLINHLNPIDKAIIILHLEGCKNAAIADIVGISLSNVSTKINRIKAKLITTNKTNPSQI